MVHCRSDSRCLCPRTFSPRAPRLCFKSYLPPHSVDPFDMRGFVSLAWGRLATALLLVFVHLSLAAVLSVPRYSELEARTRADLDANTVRRELGSRLSPGTVIFEPGDGKFPATTARWNTFAPPQIQVVVQPASEADVAKIGDQVQYCNANGIDFLATNGGHRNSASLGTFTGVQISMALLRTITI
ncbi:hypothetical protein QC761_0099790 [Podospora bellae-mahoneyi]|uniref:FAD linked oxidase N-terminal domain-containing protein n=1 Tax=Podospora bellae-mahoneyi TaxID=2093777 RepID=A0ABR0FDN2_9PEZI|nr:hypothetical protein QC761_0099790 [Podospora bellae-mahoneyi]